ncbi:MAG: hypothetical protein P8K08_26825 [Fuerstiella sp.]|nr:hypothetical protein [Fuerstiella sp.]
MSDPFPGRIVLAATIFIACAYQSSSATDGRQPSSNGHAPQQLHEWLQPQQWDRDGAGPVLHLGPVGEFDDTHIFAPCVALMNGVYHLWYSGSTGTVANRVFQLGLATGADGRAFTRHPTGPVLQFRNNQHSVLTSTLLRHSDGTPMRENGQLRMWFSSTHFSGGSGHHALHETRSDDGISWQKPSEPLLDNVYAPTILREAEQYRMWYTDVSGETWVFRHAVSNDGQHWQVHPTPVLSPQAKWEKSRLFYPTVLKTDGIYVMWYGSYWSERPNTTAIGAAASVDGITWYRNPHSPVLTPDADRAWESHYTTSQSVIRYADGTFRIWYASRKRPPFVNKYFALNTAHWAGPDDVAVTDAKASGVTGPPAVGSPQP